LTVLALGAFLSLTAVSAANAHALNSESDLEEDRDVEVCNGQAVQAARVQAGMDAWNATAPGPAFVNVGEAGSEGFCELTVREAGGDRARFYARVVYSSHPDQLQVSARFADLTANQKQGTITHELGHAGGFDHPDTRARCADAVMSTIAFCRSVGEPRVNAVSSHDVADEALYWEGLDAIYPVRNKCWDAACDRFGPPSGTSSRSAPVPAPADVGGSEEHPEG
jgi:hypothetical protein